MIAERSAEQEGRMTPEDRDGAGLKRLRGKDKREEEKIRNCVTPRERMTLPPELCLAIPARLPAEFSLCPPLGLVLPARRPMCARRRLWRVARHVRVGLCHVSSACMATAWSPDRDRDASRRSCRAEQGHAGP